MAAADTLAVWDALASRPPATNYPTLDLRNGHVVLDFDGTADESTDFLGVLPSHYAGGSFTVVLKWMATSATSGSVRWDVAFERHAASLDLDSDDFATPSTTTQTTAATSGVLNTATIAHSASTTPTAGESYRLRVWRKGSVDSMSGNAELLSVELREV